MINNITLEVKPRYSENVNMKSKLATIAFVTLSVGVPSLDLLGQVHYTYLWHLEYWPAADTTLKRYQRAWESILAKQGDQINPPQGKYNRIKIDRGVSPANAYPFAYVPHRAKYVDPETGEVFTIIVVPAAQAESWKDGYSCYDLDDASVYAGESDPEHAILVVLPHDGDNAFGGGDSYYMECVPSLAQTARSRGYVLTTVQGYLYDHPVGFEDIVHVRVA